MKLFTISKKEVSSEIIHENTVFVYIFFFNQCKMQSVQKHFLFSPAALYLF